MCLYLRILFKGLLSLKLWADGKDIRFLHEQRFSFDRWYSGGCPDECTGNIMEIRIQQKVQEVFRLNTELFHGEVSENLEWAIGFFQNGWFYLIDLTKDNRFCGCQFCLIASIMSWFQGLHMNGCVYDQICSLAILF